MEQKTQKQKTNWRLIGEISRGYRGYLAAALVSLLIAAAAVFTIPFLTSFTLDYVLRGDTSGLPGFLSARLSGNGVRERLLEALWIPAALLVLLHCVNGFFTFWRRRCVAYACDGMAKRLRDRLYGHLMEVPYDYHKHASTGDLVQRCSSDVETCRRFVSVQLMEIFRTAAMAIVACSVLFSIDVRMAAISVPSAE